MADIGFIGLGNMGLLMARNLVRAGHHVRGYDLASAVLDAAVAHGIEAALGLGATVRGADAVVTMLPAGDAVRAVYGGDDGVIAVAASHGPVLIDCSTTDVETARDVSAAAAAAGLDMIDAPVSGGTTGAMAGTLTFIAGGREAAVARARPILESMGKSVVHVGGAGHGQAAKLCNNMVAGTTLIAVCEAFALAERLGLDTTKLFQVLSTSSARCAVLVDDCPIPGIVPEAPSNRGFAPGFRAVLMLKDLRLARQAALDAGAAAPLGALAAELYALYCAAGHGEMDESGIYTMIRGL